MDNLLKFAFVCYGITLAIVQSKVARPFREFFHYRSEFIYALLSCMMCTGFWVSIGVSFFMPQTGYFLLDGFMGMGIIWLIYLFQMVLEKISDFEG